MRGVAFHFPYISGGRYVRGAQVNAPGEPATIWAGYEGLQDVPLSWPRPVGTLNLLASQGGIPQGRPAAVDPNRYATGLANFGFIAGFTGKSKG